MIKFRQKDFSKVTMDPIRLKRKIVTSVGRVNKKLYQETTKAAINPGKYTSDTASFVLENPIASTGIAAGYSVAPIPGTTAASLAIEKTAKKVPIYRRATSALRNAYRRSKLPEALELAVNAGVNSAKVMTGTPL